MTFVNLFQVDEEPISNFNDFVEIDETLECYDGGENIDEAIVDELKPQEDHIDLSSTDDEDENLRNKENFGPKEAKESLLNVRRYFVGNESSPLNALNECIKFCDNEIAAKRKQSVIIDYFKN